MTDNPPTAAADSCPCCTKVGTKVCSGCKDIAYCSAECQKVDWKFHKHLCKTLKDFLQRPAPDMRRVIYFPADGERPTLRWMEVDQQRGYQGLWTEGTELPDSTPSDDIGINVRNQQLLPQLIIIKYDDEYSFKYNDTNPAMLTATNRRVGHSWRGPIVAYTGYAHGKRDVAEIQDFSMSQYSSLIAFFITYNGTNGDYYRRMYRDLVQPKFQAVKVVAGQNGRIDVLQGVEIDANHPAFLAGLDGRIMVVLQPRGPGYISPISQRIGMPLIAWKYPAQVGQQKLVQSIIPMSISIEENVAEFGAISPQWIKADGSDVLLTKRDDSDTKPAELEMETAAAFIAYCQYHVSPFVDWALKVKKTDRLPRIKRVLEEVTPGKWTSFKLQHQKMLDESEEVTKDTVGSAPRMGLTKKDADKVVARFQSTQLPDITSLAFL